jgi:hypothetical protein
MCKGGCEFVGDCRYVSRGQKRGLVAAQEGGVAGFAFKRFEKQKNQE